MVSDPTLSGGLIREDSILLDAPEQNGDAMKEEEKLILIDGVSQLNKSTAEAPRTDVKLEDLFNDVNNDEDDEFSVSGVQSSPSDAPL